MRFYKQIDIQIPEPEATKLYQLLERASDEDLTVFINNHEAILNSDLIDFAANEDNVLEDWLNKQDPDGVWVR